MARKKQTFGWVREDQEVHFEADTESETEDDDEEGPAPRLERREHREAMYERKRLVDRIQKLSKGVRRGLPLPPEVLDHLDKLADSPYTPDRRRLAMRAKILMRDLDMGPVIAALDGDTPAGARARVLDRWCARLLEAGDGGLTALIEAHPTADRQRLRTALREARAAPEDARIVRRLRDTVQDAIGAPALDEGVDEGPDEG